MIQKILLGTYTKRDSKGVYSIELDSEAKTLDKLKEEITSVGSPTYLAGNDDYSLLFAVNKTEDGQGGIASFKRGDLGNYIVLDTYLEEGAPPCYVAYDKQKELVYAANYHKGEVSVYSVDEEGTLTLLDKVAHSGSSVHENQDSPHAHYFDLSPDGNFLIACDLGTDEVLTYSLTEEGKLNKVASTSVKPGTGPRHIVFHPNKKQAYVFGELSSEVLTFSFDNGEGTFEHVQSLSSIPEDHTDFNGGAAIRISADGKFVYASNRGHDSLAVFAVKEDGNLELVEYVPTEGEIPRDFNIDPTDTFIVVGHQDSDNLTLFERNKTDGTLTLIQKDVYAPEVVNVEFI